MKNSTSRPWSWIPTLYFAEGLPYVTVMTVAVIMYKRFGLSNAEIALYTSWLYLPWVIKPFWSPFVDILRTKRWWIISTQLLIGAGLAGVAFSLPAPFYFQASIGFFWLLAFSSATHDIAADGFYMLSLNDSEQSFFVGIRSTFYRLAMISGQGLLIILAGSLESATGLDTVDLQVRSSLRESTTIGAPVSTARGGGGEMAFVLSANEVVIGTNGITRDSLDHVKAFVHANNVGLGFAAAEEVGSAKEDKNSSWWTENVSKPLSDYLQSHFKTKEKIEPTDHSTGNVGMVAVSLSEKPKEGKDIVLNTTFAKGNKGFRLIDGERLVFNSNNWNKGAYLLFQIDPKLKVETSAGFNGTSGNIPIAWSITFFILAGLFLLFFGYHRFALPRPASDMERQAHSPSDILREFGKTFSSFFRKKGIYLALAFMLLYRLSEAMLVKIASPFLLDSRSVGGLGLDTQHVGIVYGTVGVISLTLGGILGGVVASRKGLKSWLWPMALAITLPNLCYVYLSAVQPESFLWINTAVAIEQFGYGFGFTAYMLYLIYFSDGEHKTAHYSICTGFMALGMMLPGMAAGWIQEQIGYVNFFIFLVIAIIPTLAVIPFMKVDKDFGKAKKNNKTEEKA